MKKDKHILIIGAGIIGLSSAYYLNKKGFQVTILDDTDGTDNCSYGNAGFFSPSHFIPLASPGIISQGLKWMLRSDSPFYIKPRLNRDLISWGVKFYKSANQEQVNRAAPVLHSLITKSRKLIEDILDDEKFDVGFNDQGMVMYCKTQHALDEESEVAEFATKLGQRVEIVNATEAKNINPGLDIDVVGAVYFKEDASITPHAFIGDLKNRLEENDVKILYNQRVERLVVNKNQKVEKIITSGNEYVADDYIVAAGSWTGKILKSIDVRVPMQGGKGYSFVLPNPKVMPRTCAILTEARVAVTPMQHGLRFAGTMEINGLDLNINPKRVQGIVEAIGKYFPQFTQDDFKDIDPWAGLRPCSPDGVPYIGRTKKYNNLLVATGHAMLGVTLGPITGQLMSQLVAGEPTEMDLSLMDVDRFN